jgi:cytoskeletal protein RodZ
MSDEMKELGELLRAKRTELKLSLKEIENSTSIRTGYLEAIEEGKIDQFVSGIYAQGFMKQYASFLGFDTENLSRAFPAAFQVPNEKHEFSYGIGTLEVRGNASGGVKWLPIFLWSSLGLVVLILAWYLAKALGIF